MTADGTFRVSILGLAAVALLALGLWFSPWYVAHDAPADTVSEEAVRPDGTADLRLVKVTVCHTGSSVCASAMPSKLVDGEYPTLALGMFGCGALFGLLVLVVDNRRSRGVARWHWTIGALVCGGVAVILAVLCLAIVQPEAIGFAIEERVRFGGTRGTHAGFTAAPSLSWGGFATLAGLLLGLATTWRARLQGEAAAPRVRPRRAAPPAPTPPPKSPETDPFRAPPAPPPLVLVKNERPQTVPRAASERDDEPGPTLLR